MRQWTRSDSNRRSPPCKGGAFPLGHGPKWKKLRSRWGSEQRRKGDDTLRTSWILAIRTGSQSIPSAVQDLTHFIDCTRPRAVRQICRPPLSLSRAQSLLLPPPKAGVTPEGSMSFLLRRNPGPERTWTPAFAGVTPEGSMSFLRRQESRGPNDVDTCFRRSDTRRQHVIPAKWQESRARTVVDTCFRRCDTRRQLSTTREKAHLDFLASSTAKANPCCASPCYPATNRRRSVLQCQAAVSTAGLMQLLQYDFASPGVWYSISRRQRLAREVPRSTGSTKTPRGS